MNLHSVISGERDDREMKLDELKQEMYDRGLGSYYEALAPLARNAVRITLDAQQDELLPVGVSKMGGLPDLPEGVEWFRKDVIDIPLSFVAQVNLAEAAPYDLEHQLPERGMLYFFYDCSMDGMPWGFDPEDAGGWKVYFYDGDLSLLSRREAPEELAWEDNGAVFGSARMCFEPVAELPSPESDLTNSLDLPDGDELQDAYWEWLDENAGEFRNKLLGHADPIQGSMELECEYVTNGINCGTPDGYRTAKARGLHKNADRWCLLMQVDSNEENGMMWGDVGRLYLWITREDLAARRFENCWLVLQCG